MKDENAPRFDNEGLNKLVEFLKGVAPPQTTAEKMKNQMLTFGNTPAPVKAPQSKGGASCPACGHSHKPGSICQNAKRNINVAKGGDTGAKTTSGISGHTGGNPWHGPGGLFSTKEEAIMVTPKKGEPAVKIKESTTAAATAKLQSAKTSDKPAQSATKQATDRLSSAKTEAMPAAGTDAKQDLAYDKTGEMPAVKPADIAHDKTGEMPAVKPAEGRSTAAGKRAAAGDKPVAGKDAGSGGASPKSNHQLVQEHRAQKFDEALAAGHGKATAMRISADAADNYERELLGGKGRATRAREFFDATPPESDPGRTSPGGSGMTGLEVVPASKPGGAPPSQAPTGSAASADRKTGQPLGMDEHDVASNPAAEAAGKRAYDQARALGVPHEHAVGQQLIAAQHMRDAYKEARARGIPANEVASRLNEVHPAYNPNHPDHRMYNPSAASPAQQSGNNATDVMPAVSGRTAPGMGAVGPESHQLPPTKTTPGMGAMSPGTTQKQPTVTPADIAPPPDAAAPTPFAPSPKDPYTPQPKPTRPQEPEADIDIPDVPAPSAPGIPGKFPRGTDPNMRTGGRADPAGGNKLIPFSQLYGTGSAIGSGMFTPGGTARPTAGLAAQEVHEILNRKKPHRDPNFPSLAERQARLK